VEEIVAAASLLSGPGDYYDLDQLPLIDPILRNVEDEGNALKKRKRVNSIVEISDSEPDSSIPLAPELSDGMEDDDEPTPKRHNPAKISNYTPNTRNILRLGKTMFRSKVLVKHAFPSRSAQASLGRESWEASRISLPVATAGELFITGGFTTHALLSLRNRRFR
jgi:hypothetical protein